jgi:hypothetical protein
MKFAEIEQEALALSTLERASLVAKLLHTIPAPGSEISLEEAECRDRELEESHVSPLSHQEFVHRVSQDRKR